MCAARAAARVCARIHLLISRPTQRRAYCALALLYRLDRQCGSRARIRAVLAHQLHVRGGTARWTNQAWGRTGCSHSTNVLIARSPGSIARREASQRGRTSALTVSASSAAATSAIDADAMAGSASFFRGRFRLPIMMALAAAAARRGSVAAPRSARRRQTPDAYRMRAHEPGTDTGGPRAVREARG